MMVIPQLQYVHDIAVCIYMALSNIHLSPVSANYTATGILTAGLLLERKNANNYTMEASPCSPLVLRETVINREKQLC